MTGSDALPAVGSEGTVAMSDLMAIGEEDGLEMGGEVEVGVEQEVEKKQEGVEQEQEGVEQEQEEVEKLRMEQGKAHEVKVQGVVLEEMVVEQAHDDGQEGVEHVQEEVEIEQEEEGQVVMDVQEAEQEQKEEVESEVKEVKSEVKEVESEVKEVKEVLVQHKTEGQAKQRRKSGGRKEGKTPKLQEGVAKKADNSLQLVLSQQIPDQEKPQKPVVHEPLTLNKQLLSEGKHDVVSEEEKRLSEVPHPTWEVQRHSYYSLPTLRRTAISTRTTVPSQHLAKHTSPQSLSVQTVPAIVPHSSPSVSPPPPPSQASITSQAPPNPSSSSSSLKVTTTARPSQAPLTPVSLEHAKPSLFAPIMQSDIQSMKKSQRGKTGRLRIKRLSELKPKRPKQHAVEGPAVAMETQQQSYSFSSPATIAVSSKPVQGNQDTNPPPPSNANKEFVFSPPMTRSRLRRLQGGVDGSDSRDGSFASQTTPVTTPISSRIQTRYRVAHVDRTAAVMCVCVCMRVRVCVCV